MRTQIRRRFYTFCFFSLLLSLVWPAIGQEIPPDRTFGSAWQYAGHPGDIIVPGTIVNVRHFGAAGNGIANDQPAVAAAIASLNGMPGVIYFPSGTYLIRSPIIVPSGAVLCGQNPEDTTLLFDFVGHAIQIYGNETGPWIPLTKPAAMREDTLIVSDSSVFSVGGYALLRQENDPSWNITDTWAFYSAGQVVRIATVSGNTLTLGRPLRHAYPLIRNPEIRRISANKNSGVDNLKLQRLLAGDAATRDNSDTIHFSYAAQGWVKDNPAGHIHPLAENNRRDRILSEDEEQKLLDACEYPWFRRLLIFGIETGLRIGEIASLKTGEFHLDYGIPHFKKARAKNKAITEFPVVSERLVEAVHQQLSVPRTTDYFFTDENRNPVTTDKIERQFKKATTKAGIEGLVLHDLRRTFCSRLNWLGCNKMFTEYLMGHTVKGIESRYLVNNLEGLCEELKRMEVKKKENRVTHLSHFKKSEEVPVSVQIVETQVAQGV